MSINLDFNEARLDFLLNNPRGDVGRYLSRVGIKLVALARVQVGKDTGRLARSLHYRHHRDARSQLIRVIADVPHALMHHQGTRPHVVEAPPGRQLRFVSNGRVHYAHRVLNPGTRPNRYLTDNIRRAVR